MADTTTRVIRVKVDTSESKNLKYVADQLAGINRNTRGLASSMSGLTTIFQGWLGVLGIREVARMSDEMQNLSSRLKIVANAGDDTRKTLASLVQIADRTNQSVAGTGQVYTRLAQALRGAKGSTEEILTLTESLINTFKVSGATTTETTNTIIQLSQAFSAGELRGQELRSVLEQNALLAEQLRSRFKGDIFKAAEKGAIKVSDVLAVLYENQKNVAEQARLLKPTFEQTIIKSFDKLSLFIGDVNEKFEISAKFATVMGVVFGNLGQILSVTGAIVAVWALTYLPALVTGLQSFTAAAITFAAANPLLLAFTALAAAGALLYNNWEKLNMGLKSLKANMLDFFADIEEKSLGARMTIAGLFGIDFSKNAEKAGNSIRGLRAEASKLRESIQAPANAVKDPAAEADKNMASLIEKFKKLESASNKPSKIKDILAALNKELIAGSITLKEYNDRIVNFELYKLNREFAEGKMNATAYGESLKNLKLKEFNRFLQEGVVDLFEFKQLANGETLTALNQQFETGTITLREYNQELVKLEDKVRIGSAFQLGAQNYIESVGTLSEGIAKGIENSFGSLENYFMNFIKTGKTNFEDFAQSVLDDLNKILLKALIIRPIAEGLLNFSLGSSAGVGGGSVGGGLSGPSVLQPSAKGNAFNSSGLIPFAKGGIVDSPTMFSYGRGKAGVMGEAGAEAILPLQRSGNGDLGVSASVTPVTINVINNSNASVTQTETTGSNGEKIVELTITSAVNKAIANGSLDKTMNSAYGLRRRGWG